MKTFFIISFISLLCMQVQSQSVRKTTIQSKTSSSTKSATPSQPSPGKTNTQAGVRLGTINQQRNAAGGNPSATTSTGASSSTKNTTAKPGPFNVGIHPAKDAAKPFDSLGATATNNVAVKQPNAANSAGVTDTTHNTNTSINNAVNTNSGAVDRSGQSQFGQSNWGRNSRNTVGESQWTVPPPVTSTFRKEVPDAATPTWSRSMNDTAVYSARYRTGNSWVTSAYSSTGERLYTNTEIPLVQAPRPVSIYLSKQSSDVRLSSISSVQRQGKADMYEIRTSNGRTIYIDSDGLETSLK